jgi:hypothetical protein
MVGRLEKNEQGWLINYNDMLTEVDKSEYKYLNDMWNGELVEFTIITIADGNDEWGVIDKDVAKITFEANLFQDELHNNFVVSSEYRNEKVTEHNMMIDLTEGMSSEFKNYLEVILSKLKEKGYKIVKKY